MLRYIQKLIIPSDLEWTRLPVLLVTIIFLDPEGPYRLKADVYSAGHGSVSPLSPEGPAQMEQSRAH